MAYHKEILLQRQFCTKCNFCISSLADTESEDIYSIEVMFVLVRIDSMTWKPRHNPPLQEKIPQKKQRHRLGQRLPYLHSTPDWLVITWLFVYLAWLNMIRMENDTTILIEMSLYMEQLSKQYPS